MKTVCLAALLVFCASAQPEVSPHLKLKRIDDHVYRGRQPRDGEFADLAQLGVKTVLDLRGGMIHKPWERKRVEAAGMHYASVRLSGIWQPKDEQIIRILKVLEDPAQEPVYVHCRRGYDRVGMVIAAYRIDHDHWTNEQALQEANQNGLNRFELLMKLWIRKLDPAKIRTSAAASD